MTADVSLAPGTMIAKKGVTSVSFALFGTILLRRCLSVDAVYERALHYAPVPERLKAQVESFVQHRVLAQNVLRLGRSNVKGRTGISVFSGVSAEAIYQRFAAPALNLPASIRPQLVEAELRAEEDLAVVNADFRPLYGEARRLGRRVGVVAETHWSPEQVRRLLAKVAPELSFDFIYTAAGAGVAEAGGLFRHYRKAEGLRPSQAIHFGVDDETVEQPTAGIPLMRCSLPEDPWNNRYDREAAAARLLGMSDPGFRLRFDGGLRLLRRVALSQMGISDTHHLVGAAVMGPMMVGFQRHIERRVAELSTAGRRVKVLFLARDGYLPMRVWSAANAGHAEYVEVNRRIAMIAGSEGEGGFDQLRALIGSMELIDRHGIEQMLKIRLSPKARAFFEQHGTGQVKGQEFADNMMRLVGRKTMKGLSDSLRAALMEYLRAKLDGLADCTDMVLVDIGYTGNIQKGLRRVFDIEGLPIRLHGIYLMPHGEAFVDLPGEDTVSGYLDDTVMTPGTKRTVMRDAPLIEEFCCAPVGSTRGYVKGREVREEEVRLPQEIAFCLELQDECVRYHDAFRAACKRFGIDPLADFDTYRTWTAAILARFVMMPTPLECQTFGPLLHDVSLGTTGLIATITTADITNLMGALPFPAVCSIHHPPVWLGGSLTAHTAAAGFSYALTGFGLRTDDFFKDVEVSDVEAVILKGERAVPVPVSCNLTPFGDLRLRIPVLQKDGDSLVALPLKGPLTRGIIRSLILQGGADIVEAATTRYGERQPLDALQALRAVLDGNFFRAAEPEAFLLLKVPAFKQAVSVLTMLVTPLFD